MFDGSGLPLTQAASTIVITRTHSTAAAIPATQTIAAKVRSGSTGLRNILQPLIKKGTPLPASGSQRLRAAYSIGPNLPGQIDLELFQDEGALEPDLNLAIGSFRIGHHDLAGASSPKARAQVRIEKVGFAMDSPLEGAALEAFVETYQIKYERAADCLTKDRDASGHAILSATEGDWAKDTRPSGTEISPALAKMGDIVRFGIPWHRTALSRLLSSGACLVE